MRILQVFLEQGKASGVTTFVENLTRELRALGHDVVPCTRAKDLPTSPDFDFVHIHGLWLGLHHAAAVWARTHKVPIVWSTHGMTAPWSIRHKWWKKILAWILYQRRDLQSAVLVHATSVNEVGWNNRRGLMRTCLIPLGTTLPAQPSPAKRDPHVLLFVGRIYPVKALDRLMTAFALASHRVSATAGAWKLRLVGPDEAGHTAQLKRLAARLETRFPIEFAGPQFSDALTNEYAASSALALVSHTENFGATVVDALAYGRPVVTGTKTPWREVADRKCGWWVSNESSVLAEALVELMELSDAEREAMGARGRRLIEEKYTWPAIGRAMVSQYESIR